MTTKFEHFFKPEVRAAGEDLLSTKSVYLKIGSDTLVEATVKASTPSHVTFRSTSIESDEFTVDCSCKPSSKGQMCKHIWATLVLASEKQPDFFEMKSAIEKVSNFAEKAAAKPITPEAAKRQQEFEDRQSALKQRAADARKQQYQAQKARAKERSGGSSSSAAKSSNMFMSDDVKQALKYFEANGFPLELPIDEEELGTAKRVLSRVFHPDKGGSHDEVLELNRNAAILLKYR